MKGFSIAALIVLAVGLTMAIVGAIFNDIAWTGNFQPTNLADVMQTIGYIAAALAGIVLVALGVSHAVRDGEHHGKK
ncbi:MAG: hypothetical protein FWC00_00200 [Firmicutes bacterium]|nr:hypothetical protein [Bacillota bacterium]